MLKRAMIDKLRKLLTLVLLVSLILPTTTPVFASGNGNQTSTENHAEVNTWYFTSMQQNLAVMLYDGVNREFVMDADELTASVSSENAEYK